MRTVTYFAILVAWSLGERALGINDSLTDPVLNTLAVFLLIFLAMDIVEIVHRN